MGLRVPATVRVELASSNEDAVAATTNRLRKATLLLPLCFKLMPLLLIDVEGIEIIVGVTLVTKATMTAIDVNFAVSVAVAAVGTGTRGSNSGLLVGLNFLVTTGAGPLVCLSVEPPAVIKASHWAGVATEDEDARVSGMALVYIDSDVLGSW